MNLLHKKYRFFSHRSRSTSSPVRPETKRSRSSNQSGPNGPRTKLIKLFTPRFANYFYLVIGWCYRKTNGVQISLVTVTSGPNLTLADLYEFPTIGDESQWGQRGLYYERKIFLLVSAMIFFEELLG